MKDLTALIAAEFSKQQETSNRASRRSGNPQVLLQLNSTPFIINTEEYKNAQSASNPLGDYKAAYRFSLLADVIPILSPNYVSSMNTLSKIWRNLINSMNTENSFTRSILEDSITNFKSAKMAGIGGIPEDWYNVVASPTNWCELLENEKNLLPLEIDLMNGDDEQKEFLVLNNQSGWNWKIISENSNTETPINRNSAITKISMNVLRVDFYRSWLDFELLNSPAWKIDGIDEGYYSSGKLDNNDGIFPLIPQGFLVGNNIKIEGEFSKEDLNLISESQDIGQTLSLGSLMLQNKDVLVDIVQENDKTILSSKTNQIIGFISRIVPLSPPISGTTSNPAN